MKAYDAMVLSFTFLWGSLWRGAEDGILQKTPIHNLLLHFWLMNRCTDIVQVKELILLEGLFIPAALCLGGCKVCFIVNCLHFLRNVL